MDLLTLARPAALACLVLVAAAAAAAALTRRDPDQPPSRLHLAPLALAVPLVLLGLALLLPPDAPA